MIPVVLVPVAEKDRARALVMRGHLVLAASMVQEALLVDESLLTPWELDQLEQASQDLRDVGDRLVRG